jgi:LYR motif-containing protein 4
MFSRTHVLGLYRRLLREATKFPAYNYRQYAIRRIKAAFREHQHVKDVSEKQKLLEEAEESLRMLQRQVIINSLYQGSPLVLEKTK